MHREGMKTILYIVALLFFNSVAAAFAPTKKANYRRPVLQERKPILFANIPKDYEDLKGYDDIEKNELSEPSSSSLVRERIEKGNYLDVLQIAVILFFVLTLWISGGSILSDYSTNTFYDADRQPGKSRVYIDADKLLRDEFEKVDSTVIFE